MQRVRQPADPTFTIGSPTLHRADGSSHAERRLGCSCQKGPFFPWITPTPSVRPNPAPRPPRLTHPPAGPPARPAPSAAGAREAGNAVAAAARVALRALPVLRMMRRFDCGDRRPQRHRVAGADSRGPPLRRGGREGPRSQAAHRRHHADADLAASGAGIREVRHRRRRPVGGAQKRRRRSGSKGGSGRKSGDSGRWSHGIGCRRRLVRGRRRAVGLAGVAGVVPMVPNSTPRRSNSAVDVSATASRSGATSWRSRCGPG